MWGLSWRRGSALCSDCASEICERGCSQRAGAKLAQMPGNDRGVRTLDRHLRLTLSTPARTLFWLSMLSEQAPITYSMCQPARHLLYGSHACLTLPDLVPWQCLHIAHGHSLCGYVLYFGLMYTTSCQDAFLFVPVNKDGMCIEI